MTATGIAPDRDARWPAVEPAFDQRPRVPAAIVEDDVRPAPEFRDELTGSLALVEGQEAPCEIDQNVGTEVVGRDADRERPLAALGRAGREARIDGLDGQERGQRRVVEVGDGRPDAVELSPSVMDDRVTDRRRFLAARLATDAFGERPGGMPLEDIGQGGDTEIRGALEGFAPSDRFRKHGHGPLSSRLLDHVPGLGRGRCRRRRWT